MTANDYLVGMHWHDVIVIGAGHNGLVAALLFAKKGLKVLVVEERDVIGGAARTERPFAKVPELAASTGASFVGLVPPELLAKLAIDLPLVRRDPHALLPTTGTRCLALGANADQNTAAITRFAGAADARAHDAMLVELSAMRDDVARTWLEEPRSVEETAERHVRPALRAAFVDLCRKSARDYLQRWGFESDLLTAMHAVTGFAGCNATWTTPGTGMSLLVHHMGRLAGADGAWMAVHGGMGTVARMIADEAIRHGAILETEANVSSIVVESGVAKGVVLKDGTMHHATAVLCSTDPFRMRDMLGQWKLPAEYDARLDGYARDGATMKVILALRGRPALACRPGGVDRTGAGPTTYLLREDDPLSALSESYDAMKRGALPEHPPIAWHVDAVDPSMQDPDGHSTSSLVVEHVPYALVGTTWGDAEAAYVKKLLAICDRFAPGTSDLVVDAFALHPQRIEARFGLTRGHGHHVDNTFGFADRLPYATPIEGLYTCSAGAHPAGGVIGAAGHNAALRLLRDMGKPFTAPPPRLSDPPRAPLLK